MRLSMTSTLAAALLALTACNQQTVGIPSGGIVPGDTQMLFGHALKSWAEIDAHQQVREVGVFMPLAALAAAPTTGEMPTIVNLQFPEVVQKSTYVNHMSLDYNPHGHPPQNIYTVPHLDLHYHTSSVAEVDTIDCSQKAGVAPSQIPPGYALLPPTEGECVPRMGYHASFLGSPELNPQNPQKFGHTFVLGYYGGKMHFIEPMVTTEVLNSKQNFSYAVPVPTSLGKATRYPTQFTATYDAAANGYHFRLTNFIDAR